MMHKADRVEFEKLPEKITVYRGIKLDKRITKSNIHKYFGNAWTTSLKNAISYANDNMKQILKLEIMKSNAIAYFGSATCNDVFIDFEKNPHLESQIQIIDASKIIDAS